MAPCQEKVGSADIDTVAAGKWRVSRGTEKKNFIGPMAGRGHD